MTPSEKTVKLLRKLGFIVERVEQDKRFPEPGTLTKKDVQTRIHGLINKYEARKLTPEKAEDIIADLRGIDHALGQCDKSRFWKQDMLNIADHIVFGHGRLLLAQTTDATNLSKHVTKISENPMTRAWVKNRVGEIMAIGWHKESGKQPRVVVWGGDKWAVETPGLPWLVEVV